MNASRDAETHTRNGDGRHAEEEAFDFGGFDPQDVGRSLRRAEPQVREFLARHPVPVLLGSLAAGYLLARLLRGQDS